MQIDALVKLGWIKLADAVFLLVLLSAFGATCFLAAKCEDSHDLAVVLATSTGTLVISVLWIATLTLRSAYFALRSWGTAADIPQESAKIALKIVNGMSGQ